MKNLMLTSAAACAMVIGIFACSSPRGPGEFHRPDRPAFEQFDADHDGKISLEEFEKFSPPRQEPEDMFKFLDKNADGFLTPDEFENVPGPPPHEMQR